MKPNVPTGAQELAFLRHVAEHGPLTAGQMAEALASEGGPGRSTVVTVLERLRRKGHLSRRRIDGVYVYASTLAARDVLRGAVDQFVERALSGSISPLVAYLSERREVSADELRELQRVVHSLKSRRDGDAS